MFKTSDAHPEFNTEDLIKPCRRLDWKFMLPIWIFLIALLSNALAWLVALVAMVPLVGPLIVKVLALPFIWLLNAIGYVISLVAIRRGFSKDVLTYRGLMIALIVGIVIGYIVGKFV